MSEDNFSQRAAVKPLTLVIHGVGLIGGSLGLAAKKSGIVSEVIGVGRDMGRLAHAVQLGAIDRCILDHGRGLTGAAEKADIFVLATPVHKIIQDLPTVLAASKPTAAITDVGSVKQPIMDAAGDDPRFVGSHPMAGSEQAGVGSARDDLFRDAVWALTRSKSTSDDAYNAVRALAEGIGAKTRTLDPTDHDNAVAVTSHLPHVLAFVLMLQASQSSETNPDIPYMSAGSFASATRVARSLPTLWQGISLENKKALRSALQTYKAHLDDFDNALESGDADAILAMFNAAHVARQSWPGK